MTPSPEAEALPFVRLFYGQPSQYLWEDAEGAVHTVAQREGGRAREPLMPLLFSLGQHAALEAAHSRMRTGETLFPFLDDVYFVVQLDRVGDVNQVVEQELCRHSRIRVHTGKTQVWNSAGVRPEACDTLGHLTPTHECGKGQVILLRNKECVSWAPFWGTQVLCRLT